MNGVSGWLNVKLIQQTVQLVLGADLRFRNCSNLINIFLLLIYVFLL